LPIGQSRHFLSPKAASMQNPYRRFDSCHPLIA
jgi:hypothetical protein